MKVKDMAVIAMMGAILVTLQVAFAFLPNVELVSLLVILSTLIFKRKTIFILAIFICLEGFIYGLGLWWINYLYIWYILYFICTLFKNERSSWFWAMISGIYGLVYGLLCSIPNIFIGGFGAAFAYWVVGIPFDITHGIANFIITLILFKPLYHILNRLNK
ncbi:MAG TPA: hypothetical protein GXZ28_00160 [Clostridiales bacterium]|nr:hypothetical protein [Clostridiales bacterium]